MLQFSKGPLLNCSRVKGALLAMIHKTLLGEQDVSLLTNPVISPAFIQSIQEGNYDYGIAVIWQYPVDSIITTICSTQCTNKLILKPFNPANLLTVHVYNA